MFMVMCVIDNAALLEDILGQLREAGITGATVVRSTGMQRRLAQQLRIPQRFSFERQAEGYEEERTTLWSIVPDEAAVQTCLKAIESVIGDLTEPNTGIFVSWPIGYSKGITDKKRRPHR